LSHAPRELLAHVMVCEITRILQGVDQGIDQGVDQGVDQDSAEGIMNAKRISQERLAMERRRPGFTERDVDLIYRSMN
jgi:hypothetical protein